MSSSSGGGGGSQTSHSKQLSFRAKKLDFSKPLPVYHSDELTESGEYNQVSRIMPTIATGVEKEEEEEHHLQAAISAAHVAGHSTPLYIPTPDASKEVEDYHLLYQSDFKLSKHVIKETRNLDHMLLISYDMDEEDERKLEQLNATAVTTTHKLTEEQFEAFIDQLEKITRVKGDDELADIEDIERALKSEVYLEVGPRLYDYWREKRLNRKSGTILPSIRLEHGESHADPYVCFRRRQTRTTRKTRRTDQMLYDKMIRLRSELEKVRTLLEMCRNRDKMKKDLMTMDWRVFNQRLTLRDWKRKQLVNQRLLQPDEVSSMPTMVGGLSKKKQQSVTQKPRFPLPVSDVSQSLVDALLREKKKLFSILEQYGPAYKVFVTDVSLLEELCNDIESRQASYDPDMVDCTDFDAYVLPTPTRTKLLNYAPISLSRTGPMLPMARRRIGRGGRVIYDRLIKASRSSNFMSISAVGHDDERRETDVMLLSPTSSSPPETDLLKENDEDALHRDHVPKSTSPNDFNYLPNSHLNAPGRSYYSLSHRAFLNRQKPPHGFVPGVSFGTNSMDMTATSYTPKRPRGRRTPKSMPSSGLASNLIQGTPTTHMTDSPIMADATSSLGRQRPAYINQLSSSSGGGSFPISPSYRSGGVSAPVSLVPSRSSIGTNERPSSFTYRPVFPKTAGGSHAPSHPHTDSSMSSVPSAVGTTGGPDSTTTPYSMQQRRTTPMTPSAERPPSSEPT